MKQSLISVLNKVGRYVHHLSMENNNFSHGHQKKITIILSQDPWGITLPARTSVANGAFAKVFVAPTEFVLPTQPSRLCLACAASPDPTLAKGKPGVER